MKARALETSLGNYITQGKVYDVTDYNDTYYVLKVNDIGTSGGVYKHRFEVVEDEADDDDAGEFIVSWSPAKFTSLKEAEAEAVALTKKQGESFYVYKLVSHTDTTIVKVK